VPGFQRRADVAERRARVLQLRIQQVPYTQIATELEIPVSTAKSDYRRALLARQAEQQAAADLAVTVEEAKLDAAEQAVWEVLRRRHITVQHGKIVGRFTGFAKDPDTGAVFRDADDKPIPVYEELEDDQPTLQAVDRLVRIAERRARLRGYDAPAKVEVSDARRAAIEALAATLGVAGGLADLDAAGAGAAPGDAPPGEGGPHPA
jgi:hypothetical protein